MLVCAEEANQPYCSHRPPTTFIHHRQPYDDISRCLRAGPFRGWQMEALISPSFTQTCSHTGLFLMEPQGLLGIYPVMLWRGRQGNTTAETSVHYRPKKPFVFDFVLQCLYIVLLRLLLFLLVLISYLHVDLYFIPKGKALGSFIYLDGTAAKRPQAAARVAKVQPSCLIFISQICKWNNETRVIHVRC